MLALLATQHTIGITPVIVGEFFSGVPPAGRPEWAKFLSTFTTWPDDFETATVDGSMRYDLARAGKQLSLADASIAAIALREDATIVTENVKDFRDTGANAVALSLQEVL